MKNFDPAFLSAIVGTIGLVLVAWVTGFWTWLTGRKKNDAESLKHESDAAASVMNGFILLLGEMKTERADMITRIGQMNERQDELESENAKWQRRVSVLETIIIRHSLILPTDEGEANESEHSRITG